jgi:hypothetical protein
MLDAWATEDKAWRCFAAASGPVAITNWGTYPPLSRLTSFDNPMKKRKRTTAIPTADARS